MDTSANPTPAPPAPTPTPTPTPKAPRSAPAFDLGAARLVADPRQTGLMRIPAHHFVTHGVVVGMTGSGKTGLVTVLAEEALRCRVPVLVIDVKGDLTNLLLAFPTLDASALLPFAEAMRAPDDLRDAETIAQQLAHERRVGLAEAGIDEPTLRAFHDTTHVRVITPGSEVGESLHLLSSLERRSSRWDTDRDGAREGLLSAVTLVLRLLGRDADATTSREHVLLSALAESRLLRGQDANLGSMIRDLAEPPFEQIGAMTVDEFVPEHDRRELAAGLNSLHASHALASWRTGASLDVAAWMRPADDGRTPAVVVSVAHLDDAERALVLGALLDEVLHWVRALPGSQALRAMVLFDEVYGFLPPHPANPPTKRPLVALMKQARAFGVGVVVATQNPMDLDYRALGNAGVWCIGRLQTDADRARVVEGMTGVGARKGEQPNELTALIRSLPKRTFVVRDASDPNVLLAVRPRQTMSFLRGPMTGAEVREARRG